MDIVKLHLWCKYCRRYCDERCELCQYLREASIREEVDEDAKSKDQ